MGLPFCTRYMYTSHVPQHATKAELPVSPPRRPIATPPLPAPRKHHERHRYSLSSHPHTRGIASIMASARVLLTMTISLNPLPFPLTRPSSQTRTGSVTPATLLFSVPWVACAVSPSAVAVGAGRTSRA